MRQPLVLFLWMEYNELYIKMCLGLYMIVYEN